MKLGYARHPFPETFSRNMGIALREYKETPKILLMIQQITPINGKTQQQGIFYQDQVTSAAISRLKSAAQDTNLAVLG